MIVNKFRRYSKVANLSELELQNLRHLMGGYDVTHCKMKEYAECATDSEVKQFFEKGAKSRSSDYADAGKNNGSGYADRN